MKKILLSLLLLPLVSCLKKAEPHHYVAKIDIVYTNGDKETVDMVFPIQNVEHKPEFYLTTNNQVPCVRVFSVAYSDNTVKSIGCGVRRYKLVELKRLN